MPSPGSLIALVVAAALALPLSAPAGAAPATEADTTETTAERRLAGSPAASQGAVLDVTPTTNTLNARKRHTQFFTTTFEAEEGEVRFIATELVVLDAKNTAPSEIFLGVTVSCTSPSGRITSAEGGRNVWPAASSFVVPVSFTFVTDVAGTHSCQSDVMMCVPGNCTAPTAKGVVSIVTQRMNPKSYSFLYVSPSLPSWAQSAQVPRGNGLVNPGSTLPVNQTFDLSDATGPVSVGGYFSISNCIVRGYPDACAKASKVTPRGSSSVTLALTVRQVPATEGATCATAQATKATGARTTRITWQQHHAVLLISVPSFTLSESPDCTSSVTAALTVKAGKGNSVDVEAGSRDKATSVMYAIPSDALP